MTVKSPFYNKPSTLTSVDSCHKCPLIPVTGNQVYQCNEKDQQTGFEQQSITTTSNNNKSVIEPCSSSVAKSDNGCQVITSCSNCGTTTTPLWRRSPLGETICNACGLYYKARNTSRPVWLKRNANKKKISPVSLAPRISPLPLLLAPAPPTKFVVIQSEQVQQQQQQQQQSTTTTAITTTTTTSSSSGSSKSEDFVCANCQTNNTPLWRRDESGQPICNACGLYFKLHSVHRPITMKRSTIKRRKRVTAASLVTHKPLMIHRQAITPHDFHQVKRPNEHFRPLLPSIKRPPTPDPIEPNVNSRYLPSPPMKPTQCSPIASLLNPELEKHNRSLPSPPLMPTDFSSSKHTQQVLEAHRIELKREVNNLTSLLSRTAAMLQNIDHVMSEIQ